MEVICGEWETGDTPASSSGEEYNIVLPILSITRHPHYAINSGVNQAQYVSNDIAVIKVNDTNQPLSGITPPCIPTYNTNAVEDLVHVGWSEPPPFHYVQSEASGYALYYRDFFKLWHLKMSPLTCLDPTVNDTLFTSNTYYPPGDFNSNTDEHIMFFIMLGTVCATELANRFCPTSGESGSLLMVKRSGYPSGSGFVAEGILSFIKGCDKLTFGAANVTTNM